MDFPIPPFKAKAPSKRTSLRVKGEMNRGRRALRERGRDSPRLRGVMIEY